MADWIEQAGLVLFAADKDRSVAFYRDVIGLPLFKQTDYVTVLQFGAAYLMIEPGGTATAGAKDRAQAPMTLRFNVADVEEEATRLRARGVAVTVEAFDWGTIGSFVDPDGNRCELRNHFDGFFAPRR
jgi:lactoylglutathione lyase